MPLSPESASRSWSLPLLRAVVYGLAAFLVVAPLSSWAGIAGSLAAVVGGLMLSQRLAASGTRLPVTLVAGVLAVLLGLSMDWICGGRWLPRLIGLQGARIADDALTFGLLTLGCVVCLRSLAARWAAFGVLEIAVAVSPVVGRFAAHRDMRIGQPRAFTDWALGQGHDPSALLLALGLAALAGGGLLLLPRQRWTRTAATIVTLLMLVVPGYFLLQWLLPEGDLSQLLSQNDLGKKPSPPGPKQPGKTPPPASGSGSGGAGKSDPPPQGQANSSPNSGSPDDPAAGAASAQGNHPVAIVLLHDDYEPADGMWYFRWGTLSRYDGQRLVKPQDPAIDTDVPRSMPAAETQIPATPTAEPFGKIVSTTVGLLKDMPEPPCLTSPVSLAPSDNPRPKLFLRTYKVTSRVLQSTRPGRAGDHNLYVELAGHAAGDPAWSPEVRSYYLTLPTDPRYGELAAKIVTENIDAEKLGPRLVKSPILIALALRRWVEKNTTYSLRPEHDPAADPAEPFLFGNRKGSCSHIARAMVYLLRSQGIPARVATGYAVESASMATRSSLTVMYSDGHAWAEIYLQDIGWVAIDPQLEQVDPETPTPAPPDPETARQLAEALRADADKGPPEPGRRLRFPFEVIVLLGLATGAVPYAVKTWRRVVPHFGPRRALHRLCYRAVLDRLAEVGMTRGYAETREEFAARVQSRIPQLASLTALHEASAIGGAKASAKSRAHWLGLQKRAKRQIAAAFPRWRRLLGLLHPLSWRRVN